MQLFKNRPFLLAVLGIVSIVLGIYISEQNVISALFAVSIGFALFMAALHLRTISPRWSFEESLVKITKISGPVVYTYYMIQAILFVFVILPLKRFFIDPAERYSYKSPKGAILLGLDLLIIAVTSLAVTASASNILFIPGKLFAVGLFVSGYIMLSFGTIMVATKTPTNPAMAHQVSE